MRTWIGAAPFLLVHAAALLAIFYPPTAPLLVLAGASYLVRMWAITAGYHRYFAHRAYRTSRVFQFLLALLGTTAMQQGPLWWASSHRRHHKDADGPGDPHSPVQRGFWYAHVGWIFDRSQVRDLSNVRDLSAFPELRWLDRHARIPLVGYALLCWAIAGMGGVVWGFVISTLVLGHVTFLINSVAHLWGTRPYPTRDASRNNALLAVLTLGEGWHNNHHHHMSSARQGFRWWQIDMSYYSLAALRRLGVVWAVRQPPAAGGGILNRPMRNHPLPQRNPGREQRKAA
ncbi:MAG TPA: acyl-CoA desaturase [Kofleriaceae bacterium]|nr:acyl-CoA desaturase [Kofleriaceae bacterium]